jgi:hypothetical protein
LRRLRDDELVEFSESVHRHAFRGIRSVNPVVVVADIAAADLSTDFATDFNFEAVVVHGSYVVLYATFLLSTFCCHSGG